MGMSLTVRDRMTSPVIAVNDEDNACLAAQTMLWNRIRHLPVVREGEVVGVISDHDLHLRSTVAPGSKKSALLTCREVMHVPAETIAPDATIADAATLMREHKIGCLPVVDSDHKLVGMITVSDVLGAVAA